MAFDSLLVMEIDVDGLEEAQRGLQQELARIRGGKRGAMAAAIGQLQRYAIGIAPFNTGRLRNSIFAEVQGGGERGAVATNVAYAPHQEYGTRDLRGRKFFGRTASQEGPNAVRTYQSVLLGR